MTLTYRDFEITIYRDEETQEEENVRYTIIRRSDDFCLADDFNVEADDVDQVAQFCRDLVDDYHDNPEFYE